MLHGRDDQLSVVWWPAAWASKLHASKLAPYFRTDALKPAEAEAALTTAVNVIRRAQPKEASAAAVLKVVIRPTGRADGEAGAQAHAAGGEARGAGYVHRRAAATLGVVPPAAPLEKEAVDCSARVFAGGAGHGGG
jgi:hypothetical protein